MIKTAIRALAEAMKQDRAYLHICERNILSAVGAKQRGARTSARATRRRLANLEAAINVLKESSGA